MKLAAKTHSRLAKLRQLLQGRSHLLVVLQDNPDPDAIASAMALRKLSNTLGNVRCTITHAGTIGRGENRALVHYLGVELRPCSEIDFEEFDLVALVDTQPGTGNNPLAETIVPDIVVDHHPLRQATKRAQLIDIRRNYGATATILLEYLIEAGLAPDTPLATALLFAIRSDTQDLEREASRADIEAVGFLFPIANKRMLGRIQRGRVQRGYFRMLAEALRNARVHGRCTITRLGQIDNPDMIAEVADLLLREDRTDWTMCTGFSQGKLFISIRTSQEDLRADKVIHAVVAGKGTGGGHQAYAGGQIPVNIETESERRRLETLVQKRFCRAVGVSPEHGDKLISD